MSLKKIESESSSDSPQKTGNFTKNLTNHSPNHPLNDANNTKPILLDNEKEVQEKNSSAPGNPENSVVQQNLEKSQAAQSEPKSFDNAKITQPEQKIQGHVQPVNMHNLLITSKTRTEKEILEEQKKAKQKAKYRNALFKIFKEA